MRASVVAETAGVPTVSIVCEGFQRQALATGRGLGLDDLPLAVLRGHVDTQSYDEMIGLFREHTIDQIVRGLTESHDEDGEASTEPSALEVVVSGDLDEIHRAFLDRGWTDGSPFVPPTVDRVQALLDGTGHDPFRVIGQARPSGRDITVWSVAVNAVMAGLEQRHLPVVLALAEVLANPQYGVEHSGNTTGADALVVVSGPSIAELGFNSEGGALREGTHANTAVGRWLRLYLRNVCGFTTAEHDKATFGNSTRVVLAEHEATLDAIGWPTLATDLGATAGTDTVAVARMNGGLIVGSVFGSSPGEILPYLANGLVRVTGWELTHVFGLGHRSYRPLLVISPLLARLFARHGWSKDDVRRGLWERAVLPARTWEAFIGEWSNLTAGRRTLTDLVATGLLPERFAESDDPDRLVPIVADPSEILVAVAGDPNRANAFAFSNDGRHGDWTTATIDRGVSLDLACRIDRPDLCG
ncbi:MAG: UGSC family (seleno)protein [Acidimicrobiales bacterium]